MSRYHSLVLFSFLLALGAGCKKSHTSNEGNTTDTLKTAGAVSTPLDTEHAPTKPGSFSLSAEPIDSDVSTQRGLQITFTLPPDGDFFFMSPGAS